VRSQLTCCGGRSCFMTRLRKATVWPSRPPRGPASGSLGAQDSGGSTADFKNKEKHASHVATETTISNATLGWLPRWVLQKPHQGRWPRPIAGRAGLPPHGPLGGCANLRHGDEAVSAFLVSASPCAV
jgi:hypothetical protein